MDRRLDDALRPVGADEGLPLQIAGCKIPGIMKCIRFRLVDLLLLALMYAGWPAGAALVLCPECRRQVSDQAAQCPGCGVPGETLRRSGTPAPTPSFPSATLTVRAARPVWADTVDNGLKSAPFAWTATGGTLAETDEGLRLTPAPDGTGEVQLRLKPPGEKGLFLVQWLVDAPESHVRLRYGQETAREGAGRQPTMGGTSHTSLRTGYSSSNHVPVSRSDTILFVLSPSAAGLTVRRVCVYWFPWLETGGYGSTMVPELQAPQKARASTRLEVREAVLIVQAGNSSGSAFLARSGEQVFIYTNQHVLGGARNLSFRNAGGTVYTPVSMEVAEKEDLVRFGLKPELSAALVNTFMLAPDDPRAGETVSVYGNSQGAGTVTELTGSVLSVGPQLLEVSAPFVEGNSGGPICNSKGEVVGVSSFVRRAAAMSWVSADSPFARNRRFGYRITGATRWAKAQPQAFLAQARTIADTWLFLGAIGSSLEQLKVVRFGGGSSAAPFLDIQFFKNEADRSFFDPRWSQQLDAFIRRFGYTEGTADRRLNPSEIERHVTNLRQEYLRLVEACTAEMDRTRWMTGYLRERAAESKALAEAIKNRVNTVLR